MPFSPCSFLLSVGVPVVEGSSSQDDGVVVGPFRGVAPGTLQGIPEVAPGRVAHDPLGEAPPHQEGKVHLQVQKWGTQVVVATSPGVLICVCVQFSCMFIDNTCTHLTGQQDSILVQTQHCFCLYGNMR